MIRTTVATIVVLLATTVAGQEAQDQSGTGSREDRGGITIQEEDARTKLWHFDLRFTGAADSNIDFIPGGEDDTGMIASALASYENRQSYPTFTANYGLARHEYSETERWDRTSQNLRLAHIARSRDRGLRLETVVQAQTNGWTEDRELTDIYQLSPRLDYNFDSRNRVRLFGAYRRKHYDGAERDALSPYAGVEYRRRIRRLSHWDLGVSFNDHDAEADFYDFERISVASEYAVPVGERDRLIAAVTWRLQEYGARFVTGSQEERRDTRWTPSLAWRHDIRRTNLRLEADYMYDRRESNDEMRDVDSHRFELGVRARF